MGGWNLFNVTVHIGDKAGPGLCPPCPAIYSGKFYLDNQVGTLFYDCHWAQGGALQSPGLTPLHLIQLHL